MRHWLVKALTFLVRGYQYFISPWLGGNYRFTPTCSQYAIEASTLHGIIRGLWLTISRMSHYRPGTLADTVQCRLFADHNDEFSS